MSEPVFRRERLVVPDDIDALGHVNNVVWVRFVGELAAAHSRSLGVSFSRLQEMGRTWIVQRHEIDYHRSALLGEELVEETWVEEMRGARSVRAFQFFRAADRALLVSGRTSWAFVDAASHRPRRIAPEILRAFGRESDRRGPRPAANR